MFLIQGTGVERMRKRYTHTIPKFSEAFLLLEKANTVLDEYTSILFDRLTYSIFGIGLLPQNNMTIASLDRLAYLYSEVKDIEGHWFFPEDVEEMIDMMFKLVKQQFPLKLGIKKAGYILREELPKNPFRNGIELGVVGKVMDLSKTPYLKEELPFYSRLGLGYHANRVVNEEKQLLSDAFYLLTLAENEYNKMFHYKEALVKPYLEEHRSTLTRFNENVCTISRNSVVGFFAFFESYINGLGISCIYHNKGSLSQEEINALEGKDRQGNHYLKIELRIECLQRIIARRVTYTTNNPQQLKDQTFVILFQKMRSKRDVAMHYSKFKGEIMFSPQEWLDEAFDVSELIIAASQKIWDACYKTDHYPYYLYELNFEYWLKDAKKRILNVVGDDYKLSDSN